MSKITYGVSKFTIKSILLIIAAILLQGVIQAEPSEEVSAILDQAAELGAEFMTTQDYATAEQLYQNLLAQYPDGEIAIEALKGLVILNINRARPVDALLSCTRLINTFPSGPAPAKAVKEIAENYKRIQQFSKAIELYLYAIANGLDSGNVPSAQADIALSYYLSGNEESGKAEIDKLLQDFSTSQITPENIYWIGKRFNWINRSDVAVRIHEYNSAHSVDTFALWSHIEVIYRYFDINDEAKIQEGINIIKSRFAGKDLISVANKYQATGDMEKALEIHRYNVEHYPSYPDAMKSMVQLIENNLREGKNDAAFADIDTMQTTFSGQEDLPTQLFEVARLLLWNDLNSQAAQLCQTTISRWPDHSSGSWLELCIVCSEYMKGDKSNADKLLSELLTKCSDRHGICYHIYQMGRGYSWWNRPQKAIELLNYNIGHFPEEEYAMWSQMEKAIFQFQLGSYEGMYTTVDQMISEHQGRKRLGEAVLVVGETCYQTTVNLKEKSDYELREVYFQHTLKVCDTLLSRVPLCDATYYAHYYKGQVYFRQQQYAKALGSFNNVLTNWSAFPMTRNAVDCSLSCCLELYSKSMLSDDDAVTFLDSLLNNQNETSASSSANKAIWLAGKIKNTKKKYADSAKYLKRYLLDKGSKDSTKVSEACLMLGQAYENLENPTKAHASYVQYLNTTGKMEPETQLLVHEKIMQLGRLIKQ